MPEAQALEPDQAELPPAGHRSGAGARSVLPYLTKTLQARPAQGPEARDATPAREADAISERPSRQPAA